MICERKVLALIPARGGSKGIKNKNIIDIGGKPLISYTVNAARKSRYVDDVVVSTDSKAIAEAALQYGAEIPFLRPAKLASDTAKTLDAVLYTVDKLGKAGRYYDILLLLQPTSPLRTSSDIDRALELFEEVSEMPLASVSEAECSPILMRTLHDGYELKKLIEINSTIRRQDMPKVYRVNGSLYINKINELNEHTSFNDNMVGYVMAPEHSVDIDGYADMELIRYYMDIGEKKENQSSES